jgi:hypothetical protein
MEFKLRGAVLSTMRVCALSPPGWSATAFFNTEGLEGTEVPTCKRVLVRPHLVSDTKSVWCSSRCCGNYHAQNLSGGGHNNLSQSSPGEIEDSVLW